MKYVAIINTPGYVPESEPVEFDTPAEAWEHLAEDRREHEDSVALKFSDDYSETVDDLDAKATAALDVNRMGWDGTGSVSGSTPGYQGEHDLGLVYEVQEADV
jgi:hypothetical protein